MHMNTAKFMNTWGRRLLRQRIIALMAMAMVAPSISTHAQTATDLQLILEIGKTALQVGEPVYATVRLVNKGSVPVNVHSTLFPQGEAVQIEIMETTGHRSIFQPLAEAFHVAPMRELTPGSQLSASFPIFYGGKGWTVTRRPGTYALRAIYVEPRSKFVEITRSDAVTVTVSEFDGAGQFLMEGKAGSQAGKFLLWQGGDHLKEGITRLTDLIAQFPQSVLSDYASMILGRSLAREFKDYSRDKLRAPQCDEALLYLKKARAENLPLYLKISRAVEQVRCLVRLGQKDEAADWVNEAKRLIDNQQKWEFFLAHLKGLESEPVRTP
mgnify:CR=1 FL=1|jgi:hypothetical protein